jgi:hypothetical protein
MGSVRWFDRDVQNSDKVSFIAWLGECSIIIIVFGLLVECGIMAGSVWWPD